MKKVCFLHAGTHKTGTTSIQALLTANELALFDAGLHVPNTGRIARLWGTANTGHHNVAWELNDDPRFDPAAGDFGQLLSEIVTAAQPAVVLSSEDFEYLHAKPPVLQYLRDALKVAGYTSKIIIYLRPQREYAESLYVTLRQVQALDVPFDEYLDEISRNGRIICQDVWVFEFLYSRLLAPFADVFGIENVIVRAYDGSADSSVLLGDFVEVLRTARPSLKMSGMELPGRLNDSTTVSLLANERRKLADRPRAEAGQSAWNADQFDADNAAVAQRYGVSFKGCSRNGSKSAFK